VNPTEPTTLKWDAVQEYGDGTVVEWTGPVESATPASLTRVGPSAEVPPAPPRGSAGTLLGATALALAVVALGLALRPRGS
jgi:hypothetical protein